VRYGQTRGTAFDRRKTLRPAGPIRTERSRGGRDVGIAAGDTFVACMPCAATHENRGAHAARASAITAKASRATLLQRRANTKATRARRFSNGALGRLA